MLDFPSESESVGLAFLVNLVLLSKDRFNLNWKFTYIVFWNLVLVFLHARHCACCFALRHYSSLLSWSCELC